MRFETSMSFLAELFLYSFLLSTIRISVSVDTITQGQSIRDGGEIIISSDQSFALGFFSPDGSTRRYLGIWYNRISNGTVIWVANRDTPLLDGSGVLNITAQGVLVLTNLTGSIFWSSNVTRAAKNPVAQLLGTGNLVVKDEKETINDPERYLWQSFEYPCDTFMPSMKLGRNFITGLDTSIRSWKSPDDPGGGGYTFGMDPRGFPQLVLEDAGVFKYRLGPWNGIRFVGAPRQRSNLLYKFDFVLNENETYYIFWLVNGSVPTRFVMNASGTAQRLFWVEKSSSWSVFYAVGEDQCDSYSICGPYASCNNNNYPACACLDGFGPNSVADWTLQDWKGGCARKNKLDCKNGDGFVRYGGIKLPDTSNSWYNKSMSLRECEELCLKKCNCTAYANTDIKVGTGCLLWFDDLIDMRDYPDTGQDIYVRMSGVYIEHLRKMEKSRKQKRIALIVCSIIFGMGAVALGWITYKRRRKRRSRDEIRNIFDKYYKEQGRSEDLELPIMDLTTIVKATNKFSTKNLLGQGGFGPVYKGTLPDGKEVAVKRLSMESDQGLEEFINEVILIAKLQHRNLVSLTGCCIAGDERMLIYEYMHNKSLDYFIFDQLRSRILDWHKRIRIIDGIARGLLYLHQDSRLRIIHRDLKASNILLDSDMNPKISDFGMARIFGGNQTEANTNRVVGTYGYMAPEYAADGTFSVKSDIFSFGVLVLEIVSGRKNRFFSDDHRHNLIGHAWILWMEQRILELLDDSLGESYTHSEIVRRIHVGLLCVQHRPEDRPTMSSVVLMLGGESSLPQPKQPGFFLEIDFPEIESSSTHTKPLSSNEITTTVVEPR